MIPISVPYTSHCFPDPINKSTLNIALLDILEAAFEKLNKQLFVFVTIEASLKLQVHRGL